MCLSSWTAKNWNNSTGLQPSLWQNLDGPAACSVNYSLLNPFGDNFCSLKVFLISNKEQGQSWFSAFGTNTMGFKHWKLCLNWRAVNVQDLYTFCNVFKCNNRIQYCDMISCRKKKTQNAGFFFSLLRRKNKEGGKIMAYKCNYDQTL